MRVAGNVTFNGVLRIQGDVLGDVSSDADRGGMIVVGQSGNVAGALSAPRIVIGGRVSGPTHASESIEIQTGACLAGDTYYKAIAIHPGGIIEGSLIPTAPMERGEEPIQVPDSLSGEENFPPPTIEAPANRQYASRSQGIRALGWGVALTIAVAALILANREPASIAPSGTEVALKPSATINEPALAPAAQLGSGELQTAPTGVTSHDAPPTPVAEVASTGANQAPLPVVSSGDEEKVVLVHGVNPRKPTDVFSVTSPEPSVIMRKKRQDRSDGTRVDISRGEKIAIPIAKNEIIRVVEGRNIMLFYQGRKVSPKIIASGVWLSFVPHAPSQTSDKE